MIRRLDDKTWINIFRNVQESDEEIEVTWLDPGDSSEGEWCLNCDCELFEDGFKTEKEARERLDYLEQTLLK
jgi:hypothetical protein